MSSHDIELTYIRADLAANSQESSHLAVVNLLTGFAYLAEARVDNRLYAFLHLRHDLDTTLYFDYPLLIHLLQSLSQQIALIVHSSRALIGQNYTGQDSHWQESQKIGFSLAGNT